VDRQVAAVRRLSPLSTSALNLRGTMITPSYLAEWTARQYQALEEEILLARHRLHECELFSHENLIRMIDAHPAKDFSVNTMGERPSKFEWREGRRNGVPADVLLELVERGRLWINLRNVLKHHPACREAVDAIYDELERKNPRFQACDRSANLLISSPGAIVHYHLDVPVNMLWHIRGSKRVWVYPPFDRRFVSQEDVEGIFSNELAEDLPYDTSFDRHAKVFDVQPGEMLTWPQNTPHRVENLSGLNVSLSTEHKNSRATRRINVGLANQFLRRTLGVRCASMSPDGPVAHLKETLTRIVRRMHKVMGKKKPEAFVYPVTFRVDPDAPLGFTHLEDASRGRQNEPLHEVAMA
jgi:hypothetical protein